MSVERLSHLQRLEAESKFIMREVVAECERPVMMYSIGKDSSVMLHIALKAFYPAPPPFPILHVDTTWKFREMIAFRDKTAKDFGLVNRIVPQQYLRQVVDKYAAVIASKSPQALRIGKAAFRAQAGLPLPQAYDVAVATMVDNMFADDAKEGIGAFLGKRMPEWP